MRARLIISMLRLVWYTLFGSNLCQNTNYPDWNFLANDQSFQINAAAVPKIRRWPLHFPSFPSSSNSALRSLSYSNCNRVNYIQMKNRISQNQELSNLYRLPAWCKRSRYSDSLRTGRSRVRTLLRARLTSRPTLRPPLPPVQRVPGFFSAGKAADI
jgi:hypothetical protein